MSLWRSRRPRRRPSARDAGFVQDEDRAHEARTLVCDGVLQKFRPRSSIRESILPQHSGMLLSERRDLSLNLRASFRCERFARQMQFSANWSRRVSDLITECVAGGHLNKRKSTRHLAIIFPLTAPPNPAVSSPNTSQPSEPLAVEDQTCWFAEVVQPHELALRGYLRNRFPSVDAEDVVQESYFRLLKARAKGKIALSKAYVFAVARNTARTLLHRQRIYSFTELADLPDSVVLEEKSDVSDQVNDQLRFQLALEAIDQLPPRCREIFRLAALDHLPTAEIARCTGLAENTVYAQLAIGVRKCSEFLRQRGERTGK